MPIPEKIAVTYCSECESALREGGLCGFKCKWDGNTTHERPVFIAVYWLRRERDPQSIGRRAYQ